jgi:hypothetical protein
VLSLLRQANPLDEFGRRDKSLHLNPFLCIPTAYMGQTLGLLTLPLHRRKVSKADKGATQSGQALTSGLILDLPHARSDEKHQKQNAEPDLNSTPVIG